MKMRRGFTLIEFVVVICIVATLAGFFLSRMPMYQEEAEKTVMEQTSAALQSALVLRFGALMAQGVSGPQLTAALAGNPMDWLQQKPRNYAGEFFNPSVSTVAPGHWLYDLKTHDLIYLPEHVEHFSPGSDGKQWIRFRVRLEYEPMPGAPAGAQKQLAATLFEPVQPYRWLD